MIDLSEGWEFIREKADKRWLSGEGEGEPVDLPHCWNTTDTFQIGVEYYRGWGSYRKCIVLMDEPGVHTLEGERFYGTGEVWLNGKRMGAFDAAYLPFCMGGLPFQAGENWLAIRLTNRCHKDVLPGIDMPDFCLYGGLAAPLWLGWKKPQHLPSLTWMEGRMGCLPGGGGKMTVTVSDAEGQVVGESSDDPIRIDDPRRWSPEDPYLYRVQAREADGPWAADGYAGFRETCFNDEGFFLNGERYPLHGLNRHEAMPGFGNALHPDQHLEDVQRMKDAGANLVRLSHYPQQDVFLRHCDELGLFVLPEIATWKSVRGGRWLRNAKRQLAAMIQDYRARPSIIAWGLGNESRVRKPYLQLQQVVREMDERPTIYAENHLHRALRKKTADICEVYGCNYEFDKLEDCHREGQGPVLITEGASHWAVPGDWDAEEEQLRKMTELFEAAERQAFVAGFTMWCFADYATLRKQRYTRYSGIVDAWRGPKAGYWYFKAMFAQAPFVKLMAQWREGNGLREVRLFTNRERSELRCDGETVAAFEGRGYHRHTLDFQAAPLEVVGEHASDRIDPWGDAQGFMLEPAREDVLSLSVVDGQGRPVYDFTAPVRIRGEGQVTPLCYSPASVIEVANGAGRCFFRADGPGALHFEADNLQPARYEVDSDGN